MRILDLQQMNSSLLLKWWWRVQNPHYSHLWKEVLLANYTLNIPISSFWKAISALAPIGHLGTSIIPGAQGDTSFWHDNWCPPCSLHIAFPQLYNICQTLQVSVQDVVFSQGACVSFRRSLTGILLQEWLQIPHLISSMAFTHGTDRLTWMWDPSSTYTVKSLYLFLNFRGISIDKPLLWWRLPLPPKIRAFMWLVHRNKILTKLKLHNRGWAGDITCQICTHPEDADHLFFHCYFAKHVWFHLGKCQDIMSQWSSFSDVVQFAYSLPKPARIAFLIVVSAAIWCIWRHRNDLYFNDSHIQSGRQVILTIISLVDYWTGTLSEDIK